MSTGNLYNSYYNNKMYVIKNMIETKFVVTNCFLKLPPVG